MNGLHPAPAQQGGAPTGGQSPPALLAITASRLPLCLLWLALSLSGMVLLGLFTGCSGYQIGSASLYAPDIRTVYVPLCESSSFRRNLGERLTEALVKEIELKTPFKVVNTPDADSILSVQLVGERKRVLIESPTDEVREAEVEFQAQITWLDRKGDLIRETQSVPLPPAMSVAGQTAGLLPEVGQSVATTQQEAIQQLAEQIVGLMETPPW